PPPHRWSSCLGRVLYWPADMPWPCDENGRPLFGLLQLNLAELPAAPTLPAYGLIQVFITDDPFWGAHPLSPSQQDNFRLIYHPTTTPEADELLDDFSFLPQFEHLPLQQDLALHITGTAGQMPMPPEDHRFPTHFGELLQALGDQRWEVLNQYRRGIGANGHRLGGYPGFLQDDPRPADENWELLLQLDSAPQYGLLWGDYGLAHWFYRPTGTRSVEPTAALREIWYGWESA
ncbi:MAG: DUF1963 domain-containing protein, partial [Lewinella sp.]|nr:DUF1963 domain-containing protein [Lewinella sp.]